MAKTSKKIRIIGDIHGNTHQYMNIIKDADGSVQLGDMGFSDSYETLRKEVDRTKHRFVPGNHDNYDDLPPHAMPGDWGWSIINWFPFFYIRGADSVDKQYRTIGVNWWPNEQIAWRSGEQLIKIFEQTRPQVVFSHDCPPDCMFIGRPEEPLEVRLRRGVVTNKSKLNLSLTSQILGHLFGVHKPMLWIFGHHHNNWAKIIDGCHFICLDSSCYIDVERNKHGTLILDGDIKHG